MNLTVVKGLRTKHINGAKAVKGNVILIYTRIEWAADTQETLVELQFSLKN